MQNVRTMQSQEAIEAVLRVWRTAADVVATDTLVARQQAYEKAIAHVCAQMSEYAHLRDLIDHSWSAELMAIAAVNSLGQRGHVLNHQVIAAAACWRHLQHLLMTGVIAPGDGASIEQ